MLNVIVGKCCDGEVAVVVALLLAQHDAVAHACLLGCLDELLGEQLAGLVEVVLGAL